MPYDDDSAKLAQMKAFLLSQSLYPKEETFDDGAYLLNQNPDMQQVALKIPKIPKVLDVPHNPSRRTMGLNFTDRKSTRLNSSHTDISRMPSSA
mgnify:CR=1 FL=1